jgi:hypothetical protein
MADELRDVFRFCVGFDAVADAPSFARYVQRCQIETTMPFNDYWVSTPPLKSEAKLFIGLLVAGSVTGGGIGGTLGAGGWSWLTVLPGALAGLLVALVSVYAIIMVRGQWPLPTAPHSDLPSVLKALYLQQRFTELVIDLQGEGDQVIHDRFASFVATHRPTDFQAPTQMPGVVRS